MTFHFNYQNKFKKLYFSRYYIYYLYLINLGLHLGGNFKSQHLTNLSIIYGKRSNHLILMLQKTLYELKKSLKIMENISFYRGIFFFINSCSVFEIIMKNLFLKLNSHFVLRNQAFLYSIYVFSKWDAGFLTNNFVYFHNLKRKIKFPRLPHFNIIMDYNLNYISISESLKLAIPYSSLSDVIGYKYNKIFYNIISNGKSLDCISFYLSNLLNSFFIGYYHEKLKFKRKYLKHYL
jgi:ribosomal protein S2